MPGIRWPATAASVDERISELLRELEGDDVNIVRAILGGEYVPDRDTAGLLVAALTKRHPDVVLDALAQDVPLQSGIVAVGAHGRASLHCVVPLQHDVVNAFDVVGLTVHACAVRRLGVSAASAWNRQAKLDAGDPDYEGTLADLAESTCRVIRSLTGEVSEIPMRMLLSFKLALSRPAFVTRRRLHRTETLTFEVDNRSRCAVEVMALVHGRNVNLRST